MLIFVLTACLDPMSSVQVLPAEPLELGYERDYAPEFAGCTWTRSRTDEGIEEIRAEYDGSGRLLYSRVEDINGVREVTNTWEGTCLARRELRYSDEAYDEDRTQVCDQHGHVSWRSSYYFRAGDDGEPVETFGEDTYEYELSHDGDDWTGWESPWEGWAYTFNFVGTQLLELEWDYSTMSVVDRVRYTWQDDQLLAVERDIEDYEYDFEWQHLSAWTRDADGRVIQRDEDNITTGYTYDADAAWPEAATNSFGAVYAYTWDCR